MAELYENPKQYLTAGGYTGSTPTGEPSFEDMLAGLPPEEREEAMQYITAPPSGEEIMKAMQQKNSQGEVMNMSLDQYRLFKAHNKTKEVDVISGIGEAASTVFDEISRAAGSIVDNPADALQKLTPSVIEAFAQGTRNMYGMAAQSADPNSVFFRMKNALQANGDDEEAELQQFMEAQAFNVHSMRLMTGQDTLIMDKDVINPEMTQVMSYIADPTLFVPFGGIAAKGAVMIGMGEKLAMAAARTQGIRNLVLGGAIKWGVGAPLEFMGGAIRNTIDYGIDTGSRVFETATGVAAKDIASAARVGSLGTAAGSVAGLEVNSTLASASRYYAGSLVARNVGEAASIYGEQMMKQGKTGRGVLGYAGQAIRDSERAGIKLAPHTKSLLKAIEAVDPLFVYADDIAQGAAQGAIIGGGLGYLAGGEEGFAGGVGSGMALGAVGATAGKVVSDVTGNTKIDQMAIQRKLIIEALKENGNENAIGFEAMAAMAEATGDRAFQGYIDGIIAGIDTVNPDAVFKAFNKVQYETHLKSKGIDPNTGVLLEKSRIFPELNDRTVKADVLGILRDTGGNFAGDPAGFEKAVNSNPAYAKVKPIWNRLDDNAKQVILKQIKDNGDPAFTKSLKGRQLNAHWSDMAYAEKATEIVNTLNQKNANSVPAKVAELLKAETRSDKKLTRRGQMLKEKLQADGYIDKDGNVRTSRLKDVEGTQGEFEASAGWAKSRDSSGRTEVVINLDKWAMDSGNRLSLAHELYHSIMLDSVFAPDYIDRLSQKLLGKFDPKTGRILEQALVQPDELMKFFGKYIDNDPSNRGDAETIKRKKEELKKSIEDYRTRGTANRVADATAIPLEHLVEEFGAYYFSKWVKAQPIDYMFRGGEFGGIRGLMEMASDGWLDYWKGKVNEKNPQFDFDGMGVSNVSKAFERDGKRVSSRSLDLFMRDIVRIEANRNSNNGFDVNKLSKESREWFLKVNGLRGAAFGQLDQQGNVKKPKLRRYTAEEIRQGKEMFKVLESLPDAAHKDGMRRDGDGNWSGQPNTAQINALVGAGFIQRAWFDRMARAYDIVNGNGSNVVEFGYLGYSAHIGDGNERVYGAAVPFKNRRAVLIGVDFKVRADGTVYSNLHTLDLKVIEARGNEVWKDPQTRELWKGSRTNMEADFYAYLSNASLPSGHKDRKPSARLLDNSDGLGGQRRDALHQMLGFHKGSDMPYINRPISEIPIGIRHSVTTFSNDGIVNMRVDNKPRYDFNFENAHLDLSRNFMPDEMRQETTPSGGKIIKHATGYNISKQAGDKFKVFDPEGKMLGAFDTVADAGRAAQKHYNETFDKSVEGKDPAVPPTEIPPSRRAYIDRELAGITDNIAGGKEKFLENVNVLIDRILASPDHLYPEEGKAELLKIKKSIEETGNIKISELKDLKRLEGINRVHDMKRLPYYNYDYFMELIDDTVIKNSERIGKQYDNMYPMEIKSALHGTLAQIFQDYPQITAKALIGKIQKYGSLNKARLMQEATEIGLIDLLKSKPMATKIKKDIFRVYDRATESFTGEVKTKEIPVQYEPFVDIQEILDYAKSREIRVTIEEGAKEVNHMDTYKLTLGGDKDNYKETAIRINPEYAHGVQGHYGENTIVHFRTTERVDAEGNRVLFIEEVQANNPYNTENPQVVEFKKKKTELDSATVLKEELIKRGLYVLSDEGKYHTAKDVLVDNPDHRDKVLKSISKATGSGIDGKVWSPDNLIFQEISEVVATSITSYGRDEMIGRLDDVFTDMATYDIWGQLKTDKAVLDWIDASAEINKKIGEYRNDMKEHYNTSRLEYSNVEYPENLIAIIADRKAVVDRLQRAIEGDGKRFPMTDVKDWSLSALKGIIRQAIRDGLDKITLTHPDDSPTRSYMKVTARRPLYGKIIPELWGSWLEKYGIEIKQSNKLADAGIEKRRTMMLKVTDKIHEANKLILEKFQQVGNREDFSVIQRLTELLVAPVHDAPEAVHREVNQLALHKINNQELSKLILNVGKLRAKERQHYEAIETIRSEGMRGIDENTRASTSGAEISAEAIDRGMTFELNDRLKRDFLDGKIQTHMMPAEDNYSGGRVYDQKGKQFLSGFLGLYAAENPDRVKGINLQFMKRADGSHRIRLTDNSKKGESADIGHITANIQGDTATLSSHINEDYRGKKLAYVVYSEMAERLRAMGVTAVDGTIVNPDGVPVKVRERIIGDTRDLYSGKRINYVEAANRIQDKQALVGKMGGVDVTNTLYKQARYMPTEGEQEPIRLSGKKKTISTKKVSTNQYQMGEGDRYYDTNSRQWTNGFIGRYAEENPILTKGLKLSMKNWDKRTDDYGRRSIELKEGNKLIGRIDYEVKKGSGGKWLLSDPTVRVWEQYRGKGYSNLLYSEMAERARFLGAEDFLQRIENDLALPMYAQVNTFGFGESKLINADRGQYFPPTKENFDKLKKPQIDIMSKDGSVETVEGYEPWVHSWSKIFSDRHYMPAEGEQAPVKWVTDRFLKEGYNMEVIWMKPSRFLNLSANLTEEYKASTEAKDKVKDLVKKMKKGTEIDRPYLRLDRDKKGNLVVKGHEGRHRAMAIMELYGDKYFPVEMDFNREDLKQINRGDYDFGVPEEKKLKGSVSRQVLEDKPLLNEDRTGHFQPAEENALVQNGFEKSELNKQLLASGHIVLGFDERTLEGKAVVINNPDTMMTGTLETPSGKILAEGEGGLNFVSKFADIWANSKEAKARTTANNLKKAQQENGGIAYLSLTRGSFENALNSHTGAKAGMGILEYFVEQGYISLEEFRNALKDSGRKYGIEFNATRSAKDIHSEIASKFFGVSDSTFERRGDFVKDVITHLAENGESGHKNIDKISEALGANRLGRKIQFAPTGIREAIGLMLSDKRANVDPSHVYAYIEITGNISVEKTENGHKSYPWHIVQRDKNGNKIRPRMLIPEKTNYVTDVFLNKNKQEVPRKGGATKLGSNQVGEAYGYVKPAANIPEGKPRLAWQPAEFSEFTTEQTAVGRILKNAKGYAIILANNKFRVYNPSKAILGVYSNEEEAKKRIYREIPKR